MPHVPRRGRATSVGGWRWWWACSEGWRQGLMGKVGGQAGRSEPSRPPIRRCSWCFEFDASEISGAHMVRMACNFAIRSL